MARGQMIKNPDGEQTGPVWEARWDSTCAKGDTIDQGEEIVAFQGEYYHVECAEDAGLRTGRA
jgi:hypothetical protein